MLTTHEIATKHNVEASEVKAVMSKPAGCGVIRVYIVKIKRTFHIYDESDNSEGYYRVVGESAKSKVMAAINEASKESKPKSRISKVTITFSESRLVPFNEETGGCKLEFTSEAAANAFAKAIGYDIGWDESGRPRGSYKKTDFVMEFEDGSTHSGRLDILHADDPRFFDFSQHVANWYRVHSSRKPAWMDQGLYENNLQNNVRYSQGRWETVEQMMAECDEFLATHELPEV